MRLIRALILGVLALSMWLAPIGAGARAQSAPQDDGQASVFFLGTADPQQNYSVKWYGTAFFVGSDGLAVTASHVVNHVMREPGRYVLIALWNHEFYTASVVCAYPLPYNPGPIYRDIAEIRLTDPLTLPHKPWSFVKGVPEYTYTPHEGALPTFPALPVASGGASGTVHIPGFGFVSAIPRIHISRGSVARTFQQNGVPLVELALTQPIEDGDSGAPILNEQGGVVGVVSRQDDVTRSRAYGIDAAVLDKPCQ